MKYLFTEATLGSALTDNNNGGGREELEMPVPRVQKFSDFREFLRAFYNESKQESKKFSHRYFALRAGFSSPNFLHLVINGKRNLTEKYIHSFAAAMKLKPAEKRWFEIMVLHDQAKERAIKDYYDNLLTLLNQKEMPISESEFIIISRWQNVIITELAALNKLPTSHNEIKSLLEDKISLSDITFSLKKLSNAGIIKMDENGKYQLTHTFNLTFLPIYQRAMKLAKDILCKIINTDIFTEESMITLSEGQYEMLKQRIKKFKDDIIKKPAPLTANESQGIYHLNIQLASITKKISLDE